MWLTNQKKPKQSRQQKKKPKQKQKNTGRTGLCTTEGMTSLHFDECEMVTLQLSKEAYEILKEIQTNGGSADKMINSMILAFDKCRIKPGNDE